MKLSVDTKQRYAKMRAHTATHLLHAELAKIFPNTKQAGSFVDSDVLRFDFFAERPLTSSEIKDIENQVNTLIYQAFPVDTQEVAFDEAIALGAKAFFEDKYGDRVRLVRVQDETGEKKLISVELCGGTHVSNTKDIGAFTIIGQEAVASGIKRISGVTGPKVIEKIHEMQLVLDALVERLEIKSHSQISDKLGKVVKEYGDMKAQIESMETKLATQILESTPSFHNEDFEKIFKFGADVNFKLISIIAKDLFKRKQTLLIYTTEGSYLILAAEGSSAKDFANKYGLKGGGNEIMVQGKDDIDSKVPYEK